MMKNLWRLWAQALGEKSGESDSEADAIARFRTIRDIHNTDKVSYSSYLTGGYYEYIDFY